MAKKQAKTKTVEALKHDEATRKNIPTAEYQSVMQKKEQSPVRFPPVTGAGNRLH